MKLQKVTNQPKAMLEETKAFSHSRYHVATEEEPELLNNMEFVDVKEFDKNKH